MVCCWSKSITNQGHTQGGEGIGDGIGEGIGEGIGQGRGEGRGEGIDQGQSEGIGEGQREGRGEGLGEGKGKGKDKTTYYTESGLALNFYYVYTIGAIIGKWGIDTQNNKTRCIFGPHYGHTNTLGIGGTELILNILHACLFFRNIKKNLKKYVIFILFHALL